ncbi:hypothetical protein SAMN05421812_105406 [Asanoa hainanensis]|uniref:Helix-turn-helix domain-containing protein n=1 Tax=Asanoa hainanensis TaxID=560556 RepID=A0A239MGC7_9ACTN|nr:hypothetical protein [Asanoa hainanensis]SNT41233.1 hypothetical protein SAMN05421812_105406 [Asanoa hainanensis]
MTWTLHEHEDDIVAAYIAGQPLEKIAARFEVDAARVELIVDRWLPPTGLQVPGTRLLVATGIGFLVGSMAYLLGARTAFLIVLGIVAVLVALPILTSLAPLRGRR